MGTIKHDRASQRGMYGLLSKNAQTGRVKRLYKYEAEKTGRFKALRVRKGKTMNIETRIVSTGILPLDALLGGRLHAGSLNVIAGRPGTGKTSLAIQITDNISASGKTVMFFSLEMSAGQVKKCYSILKENQQSSDCPFIIDDIPGPSVNYFFDQVKSLEKCDAVVIDYLQLIDYEHNTQPEQLIQSLKCLASDCNVPVIVTSQVCKRIDKLRDFPYCWRDDSACPDLTYIKCLSGPSGQDVDVMLILRREFSDSDSRPAYDIGEINVVKNSYGDTGVISGRWNNQLRKFEVIDN
ncbi:MAG: DnaB-like helicase C-terminal domain-containing protein [Clostridia bacterium]|nr:DnaB-like helicase C-terminal domain-containing protein [Clostridia bacterium]